MRFTLNHITPWTDDFSFLSDKKEILVISNPPGSICEAPVYLKSKKTLDEHIRFVNENQIKKAFVVGESIDFIRQCPSLEELEVVPSYDAQDFDFSPLSDLPNLRKLQFQTEYGPPDELRSCCIDYSRLPTLEEIVVRGPGHKNVETLTKLKALSFEERTPESKTLVGAFDGRELQSLSLIQSPVPSLRGLEKAPKLKKLCLAYNRSLGDISALENVKDTLTELEIESCGRIKDFSVLKKLYKMEYLKLVGKNLLPDLSFIKEMPNLKSFGFFMNVADGDLSMCLDIPFVAIHNRRHYNLKNEDFQKNRVWELT